MPVPGKRELPIHDETHTRLAWEMVDRTKGLSKGERAEARRNIKRRAKELGMDTSGWGKVKAEMVLWCMSLDVPTVAGHPNRMPFSGVLTKIGLASDQPPHGADGKRVLLTHDAAEKALASLLGMGVDLTAALDGHDAQNKVGVITGAHIEGEDLKIEGFIYAADFPNEALRIHLKQSELGFSFEAQNLAVESLDADPLVIKDCVFTGAAILMKNDAAYQTTSLAAAAAIKLDQEQLMTEEMKAALGAVVQAAIAPLTERMTKIEEQTGQVGALAAAVDDLKKNPPQIHANAATIDKVEPHAKALESCAASCEAAGIGLHSSRGHVAVMRRMAGNMRADAAMGKMPHEYNDGHSYWAAAELVPGVAAAAAPKVEDSDAFKKLKADSDKLTNDLAAANQRITDLQAAAQAASPAPDRKTLPPIVSNVLAKAGIEMPSGDNKLSIGSVNAALDKVGGLSMAQRAEVKLHLQRAGAIDPTAHA